MSQREFSKSYPYFDLARLMQIPYWVVLCWQDTTYWGFHARSWLPGMDNERQATFLKHMGTIDGKEY